MLTERAYLDYCDDIHRLSNESKDYINLVRTSQSSRMVGANGGANVCLWPMSRKMGHTVSLESRGPEQAFFTLSEYDDSVLEYWDQPEPIKVVRTNKNGQRRAGTYTPDALLLTQDGPLVVEVKPAEHVKKMIAEGHPDWAETELGVSYSPAVKAFSKLGLKHTVFIYTQEHQYRVANIKMLLQSRTFEYCEEELLPRVNRAFEDHFFYSLYDLKSVLKQDSYTGLFRMIDEGVLYADLDATMLTVPRGCAITRARDLVPDAMAILHSDKLHGAQFSSEICATRVPSERHAARALKNLNLIETGSTCRTAQRAKLRVLEGSKSGLTPFQSLIPKYFNSGNRNRQLALPVVEFLNNYILSDYANKQGKSAYRAFTDYSNQACAAHPQYEPVCRKTFDRYLSKIPAHQIALKRGGARAANSVAPPTDPLVRELKAQCAWQTASADHALAQIFVVIFTAQNGEVFVAKPWITVLVDHFSRAVLGCSVSLSPPTRRSVARAMRDCVRRHGKLPKEISVDRGPDFTSVFFASLLADRQVTMTLRPTAYSRYGSEVEGFFGEFKKEWLSQRNGNTVDFKSAREINGDKAPAKSAVLTPYDFYREFLTYIDWKNSTPRGISVESSAAKLARHESEYPFIAIPTEYNEEFMIASSVECKAYTVDQARGLHIGDMHYSSPKLAGLAGVSKKAEVRVDSENPHVVYALIRHEWVPCFSSRINEYAALDPVSQLVAGFEIVEARKFKKQLKEKADRDLAGLVREYDADLKERQVNRTHDCQMAQAVSPFSQLDLSEVTATDCAEWDD